MFRFFNRRANVQGSDQMAAAAVSTPEELYGEVGDTAVALSPNRPSHGRRVADRENVVTVGVNVSLEGKISGCAMLFVEGDTGAKVTDCAALVVGETGTFRGTAHVNTAEIAGQVTGTVVCAGRLVLRASGRVKGKVRYGSLEIETGADLSGNIAALPRKQRAVAGEAFFGLERFAKQASLS
jgi:cytoskeletal protein CcmA (bactofilin family)